MSSGGVVGTTAVGGDQQPTGIGMVVPSPLLPPAADGLHCEFARVVVGPDVDPAGVAGDVVDPVWDDHGLVTGDEGVAVDTDGVLARPPGSAGSVAATEPLLGLGVDADDRLVTLEEGRGGGVDVRELGITVRVTGAFRGLGGALQAVSDGVQQASDGRRADRVVLHGQRRGQRTE